MTAHSRMLLMKCQTSFVALNIEPEDDSEDEIDDSKEIQVGHMSDPWEYCRCRILNNRTDRRGFETLPSRLEIAFAGAQFL